MIKYIVGFLVVAISTVAGKKFTEKYKCRYDFFKALSAFNSEVIRDMAYKKDGLLSVMKKSYGNDSFDEYLKKVAKSAEEGTELPEPPEFLEREDGGYVKKYFSQIGRFSSAAETDLLLSAREELNARTEEHKSKSDKFAALGAKLGFAVGMTVFIIII
ncbi:MAG: hypothetical protein J5903_00690 [Clostridia bacterium]|nr:hypothetical protein [Clostridia bacterium]